GDGSAAALPPGRGERQPAAGSRRRRERDLDGESALGSCARDQLGIVRGGDRLDDRESQSVAAVVPGPGTVQALERLEETLDLPGRDRRARVRDRQIAVPVASSGGDLDVATRPVVADRV